MANATHSKKKRPNKQHDVRAASLLRMAKEHRSMSESWRKETNDPYNISTALYVMHADEATVLENEAKVLRSMR